MIHLAIGLVVMAYVLYTISIFSEKNKKKIELWMVMVFASALVCDLLGTGAMALIHNETDLNIHSVCGYLALAIMIVHFVWAVLAIKQKGETEVLFSKYSRLAWIIWSSAFFTGIPK
ncbi:TIGR03987 family protein [Patescibacteria group bacterium]|nr:TIGR03987 family protein [Patescibacteria group bacterium]